MVSDGVAGKSVGVNPSQIMLIINMAMQVIK